MVAIAERPTPIMPTRFLVCEIEHQVSVTIFDCSPRRVIREVLELRFDQMWRKDHPDQGMRDSGLWSRDTWRKTRGLAISVTVGCSCSRDCCGHLCRLSYEITYTSGLTIVVTSMGFNY